MGLILGLYWAVSTNLTVGYTQELTEGAGFAVAHQQGFGIAIVSAIAEKFKSKKSKKIEDIELPGFLSIFNENMVATAILMLFFFGIIMTVLGKDYFVTNEFIPSTQNFFFYIMTTSLQFAVNLAILQLGVRTFVS